MPAQEPVAIIISMIEQCALLEALGFEQAAGGVELVEPDAQILLDAARRLFERRLRRHVMRVGIDLDLLELGGLLAGERIEFGRCSSISSPNKEKRQARSSKCEGKISTVSPRTRKVPRTKLPSLRL